MADIWRRYWPLVGVAVGVIVISVAFSTYLTRRADLADQRAERQRAAICAILANIPGHVPTEIVKARLAFARSGHPRDCQPIVRAKPQSSPSPSLSPTPVVTPTVIVEVPAASKEAAAQAPMSQPTPRATHRKPSPAATPTRKPTPRPTPTPTCLAAAGAVVCLS